MAKSKVLKLGLTKPNLTALETQRFFRTQDKNIKLIELF